MIKHVLATVFILAFARAATAADWPQWLGPNRDGTSTEKIAPWKGSLKEVWKKPVAEGNSSPIVAGGLLFLHTKVKDKDSEMVQAFDAKTGDLKWEKTYEKAKFKPLFGEGPRSTPSVDGEFLFTLGNTGVLICWNALDGKMIWQKDTLKEFKEDNLRFGVSTSPIVVDENVLVMTGRGKTGVAAFNKKDGKFAWKSGEDAASYSSPIAIGSGPDREVVFLTGANVLAVSPAGKVLWKFPFKDRLNESSTTPVKAGDILIASSVTAGAVGLKASKKDDTFEATQIWKNPDLTCYFSTPVPVGNDHVYMVTASGSFRKTPSITLRCVDIHTGKQIWNQPNVGKYHSAILKLGDDKLLVHTDGGDLILLAPDVKEYKELAKAKVCGETWAHPALANGLLYVRDAKDLICLKMTGE